MNSYELFLNFSPCMLCFGLKELYLSWYDPTSVT
jgi:hypothetical protein